MNANRGLDYRVALLLGWTEGKVRVDTGEPWLTPPPDNHGLRAVGRGATPYFAQFSTDENGAALVLDRIAALGWAYTLYGGPYPGYDEPIARVCIVQCPGSIVDGDFVSMVAGTRPMAICLAFVQAMERWGDE